MKQIIILFFLLGLFSCTKVGRNITVKGKVVNPINGTTYSDIKIQFVRPESFSLPGGYKEIKHVYTDLNGEFELNATRLGQIFVQVQSGGELYDLGWHQDGEYISDDFRTIVQKSNTMEADFHVVPYGNVVLDIQNINCSGPSDSMWFRSKSQFDTDFPDSWSTSRVGCYSYTSSNPNSNFITGERTYQIRVVRSGVETVLEEIFNIKDDDTTIINLHY